MTDKTDDYSLDFLREHGKLLWNDDRREAYEYEGTDYFFRWIPAGLYGHGEHRKYFPQGKTLVGTAKSTWRKEYKNK